MVSRGQHQASWALHSAQGSADRDHPRLVVTWSQHLQGRRKGVMPMWGKSDSCPNHLTSTQPGNGPCAKSTADAHPRRRREKPALVQPRGGRSSRSARSLTAIGSFTNVCQPSSGMRPQSAVGRTIHICCWDDELGTDEMGTRGS